MSPTSPTRSPPQWNNLPGSNYQRPNNISPTSPNRPPASQYRSNNLNDANRQGNNQPRPSERSRNNHPNDTNRQGNNQPRPSERSPTSPTRPSPNWNNNLNDANRQGNNQPRSSERSPISPTQPPPNWNNNMNDVYRQGNNQPRPSERSPNNPTQPRPSERSPISPTQPPPSWNNFQGSNMTAPMVSNHPPQHGNRQSSANYKFNNAPPLVSPPLPNPNPRPLPHRIDPTSPTGQQGFNKASPISPPPASTTTPPQWRVPNDNNNRSNHLDLPEHRGGKGNAIPLNPIRQTNANNKRVDLGYDRLQNLSLSSDEDLTSKGAGRNYGNNNNSKGSGQHVPLERRSSASSEDSSSKGYANRRRSNIRNLDNRNKSNNNGNDGNDGEGQTKLLKKKKKPLLSRLRFKKYDPNMWELKRMGRLTQFSNERLYMHWIRLGVLQGSIALTLLNFVEGPTMWVAIGTLMLALLTLLYGTTLYHKRHLFLICKRQDVKYFARTIPTLLTIGLFVLYAANFAVVMLYGDQVTSPMPWTEKDDLNFKSAF
ncbi:hypothetical protein BGX27_000751 [Mortierella sp. AM989]|nr:hypothetical protein BGX27_000751 [Mortierella sp. AM989]